VTVLSRSAVASRVADETLDDRDEIAGSDAAAAWQISQDIDCRMIGAAYAVSS
jgi:hypothetical protein